MHKVIVVGAGIAGIASAIRLKAKGFEVEVIEANQYPGGKLSQIVGNGYRFDAGPSLFTMPYLVGELFELAGKTTSKYFEYQRLEEICSYFWEDGTRLVASANIEEFANEIQNKLSVDASIVKAFLAKSGKNYAILEKLFLQKSLHKLSTWIGRDAWKGYLNILDLGLFETMHQANQRQFGNPKLVQLFDRYATYNGSDPYQTPATLNIIPHLEYGLGAYLPKGGMVSITNSLVQLAKEMGVIFRMDTNVKRILVEAKKIKGVEIIEKEGKTTLLPADIVVSNMDISATYYKLLPDQPPPQKLLSQPKSSSGIVFYWGIKKQFEQLGLHNIFFSEDYKKEFSTIFQKNEVDNDPTIYINITSKYESKDAPKGHENWFVLINVPPNSGQNWEQIIKEARKNILNKVSKILGEDISQLIDYEQVLDPISIELRTSSSQGALYGNSSNNRFAAFLRHPNFSKQIQNLYFVGGSVHPGGGIPLALNSAKIMADMI
ncbi:MAG: 1-hydroxycarotenoid 3,4-desaturase CrtD [Bacteroidota bacterium]